MRERERDRQTDRERERDTTYVHIHKNTEEKVKKAGERETGKDTLTERDIQTDGQKERVP